MSGFYRLGKPGEDSYVHLNTGRKSSGAACVSPRFKIDDPQWELCRRPSVALCDQPGCDAPMCELHRAKHQSRANTDYCPLHKEAADART